MSDTTVSAGVTSSGLVLSSGDVWHVLSGGAAVSDTGAGTVSWHSSKDILMVTENGSNYDPQPAGNHADARFNLTAAAGSGTSVGVTNVTCFAIGTRIMTQRGDIAVSTADAMCNPRMSGRCG